METLNRGYLSRREISSAENNRGPGLSVAGGHAEIKGIDPRNILYTVTRTIVLG